MDLTPALSHRDRAILRAVGDGTAELSHSVEPDLFLDGRCCSDQAAARKLARGGLIAATHPAGSGQRVPARLTHAGHDALLADPKCPGDAARRNGTSLARPDRPNPGGSGTTGGAPA